MSPTGALAEQPTVDLSSRDFQDVNPQTINLVYSGTQRLRDIGREEAAVLDGDWDQEVLNFRFTDLDEFRGLVEHIQGGLPWADTRYGVWAQKRVDKAVRKSRLTPDQAEPTIAEYFNRFDDVYNSIAGGGYQSQSTLGTGFTRHEVEVAIDRDGQYIFVDGRHRLAVARMLELETIPVRVIARHPQWLTFRERVLAEAEARNGILYHQVVHPDLIDIPAQHEGTGRLELVLQALQGIDPLGKHLLDIGANWGQVSQQVSKLGYCTTGVEANRKDAWFADKIRVATSSEHRIWWGSIFEYPNVERQDVILALNVFHHLIATKDRYDRLVKLLPRFRADTVVFEPHRSLTSPEFMTRAYKNFIPEEFAEFVAERSGMSDIQFVGAAPDGRKVFKLTR